MSKHVESIDRRAREYAEGICPNNEMGQIVRSTAYAVGALEERQVLIEKACEWLWNEIYERIDDSEIRESLYDDNYRANLVAAFREAIEE